MFLLPKGILKGFPLYAHMVSVDVFFKKIKLKKADTLSSKVKLAGVEKLRPYEQSSLESAMNRALLKFEKTYGNIKEFKCYIKTHERGRGKIKYSIHLYLVVPGSSFTSEQADFDFNTAVSWAIKALEKEVLRAKEKYKYKTGKGSNHSKSGQIRDFVLLVFLLIILGLWFMPDLTKAILGNLFDFGRSITGGFIKLL